MLRLDREVSFTFDMGKGESFFFEYVLSLVGEGGKVESYSSALRRMVYGEMVFLVMAGSFQLL